MNKDIIHIAYAFDDNYTEISCVSMASVLYNTKKTVHFYIVESKLSDDSKNMLVKLKDRFPHGEWSFHTVENWDEHIFSLGLNYFTKEAFYRLLLPEMFPDIDKMIYLDGDTVIERDIAELWDVDLCDKYCGAVPNLFLKTRNEKELLNMKEGNYYFCSGVLLLDLSKLREFELFNKAETAAPYLYDMCKRNDFMWYPDQDILNYLLGNNCCVLPVKFNLLLICLNIIDFDGTTLHDWRNALMNPVIIHYGGDRKPDKITGRIMYHPMWERYYFYKAMTPYADIDGDNKKIIKYRQMEAQMDNALIIDPDRYIHYKKHDLFMQLADGIQNKLKGKKLVLWGAGVDIEYIIVMLSIKDIYADAIVDGIQENHGRKVFHYKIQNTELLQSRNDDYFILICMRNEEPAKKVMSILGSYGYDRSAYYHIYEPLWKIINRA